MNRQEEKGLKGRLGAALRSRRGLKLTADEVREVADLHNECVKLKRGGKESSSELSTLAGRILNMTTEKILPARSGEKIRRAVDDFVIDAHRLAGSVLSQDETKGQ